MPLTRVDILVWDDGHAVARKILEDGVYMIGRDPGCTLQLVSDRISREHARVIVHDDSVVVEDLGSSNGMYFDGHRTRVHTVADGHYLFVDPFVLEFRVKHVDPVVRSPRPMVTMRRSPRIVRLTERAGAPNTVALDRDVVSIGRGSDRAVCLPDRACSRQHAEIHRLGARFILRDLASVNGTYVNGKRVVETSLEDGDELRIGATLFRFDAGSAAHAR
jgi:pSer/pThr/pTyr-binding forkhead associated (FHA) protein